MTEYTFQDRETVVTTTTTANLLRATDPILVFSGAISRAAQATVGTISAYQLMTTTTSTATLLNNNGFNLITSASSAAFQLTDPTIKGQVAIIWNSSTTSTAMLVTPISATISATESTAGQAATIVFKAAPASITLTAQSTSLWLVTARSGSLVCT